MHPGLTFRAGARNALKLSSGHFLGSLSGLGPEMLQNCPPEVFWAHFPGYVQHVRQTHVRETLCSTNSMFNKPYVQHTRVQQNDVEQIIFPYVQQTLCSTNLVFKKLRFDKPYVQHQWVWLPELCMSSTVVGHSTKCGVLKK